jgi:hypothetical protein
MASDFENLVRDRTPGEALLLHLSPQPGGFGSMIELNDGRLMNALGTPHRTLSMDGGETWSAPEPLLDPEGNPVGGGSAGWVRLKSGGIGLIYGQAEEAMFGHSIWFARSTDEGKTWSRPTRVSEPYNNAYYHNRNAALVTSSGRVVIPVYNCISGPDPVYGAVFDGPDDQYPSKGRALLGDQWAVSGAHDYENLLCYSWAYYSDDEGETWHRNRGGKAGGAGGELMVNIDYSAGGHHSCEEPGAAEVSPGHLLMLLRTPLGRLYQSWSNDDGTTWCHPEPTTLASARVPVSLTRIPGTDDLLLIWNQASADEIQMGRQRIRLSSAISRDGGVTWRHGPNVLNAGEDDVTHVPAPPIQCYRSMLRAPKRPADLVVGHYPATFYWQDRAIIIYGCMEGSRKIIDPGTKWMSRKGVSTTVCVAFPISWFYSRCGL